MTTTTTTTTTVTAVLPNRRHHSTPPEPVRCCPCGCTPQPPPAGTSSNWHDLTGPAPLLIRRYRQHGATGSAYPRWVDHPYKLRGGDGTWTYVAEPYDMDHTAISDLAWLARHGFRVTISTGAARHNPGRTIAVAITPDPSAHPGPDDTGEHPAGAARQPAWRADPEPDPERDRSDHSGREPEPPAGHDNSRQQTRQR